MAKPWPSLRKEIFERVNPQVPASTTVVRRGTDFAAEGVFGNLPRWFLANFDSANEIKLTCRPIPTAEPFSTDSSFRVRETPLLLLSNLKKQKASGYS